MDKNYFIFQENGLFGAKDQAGDVVIKPQYTEMNPFSCGLSLVRDDKYRYTYVNPQNKPLFPFGLYTWCDNAFCCGFARVMEYHFLLDEKKWGIINTMGQIVLPIKYDNIWTLKEDYIHAIRVSIDGNEKVIDANMLSKGNLLTGLVYTKTYSVEDFKKEFGLDKIHVKVDPKTGMLFFPFRTVIGEVALCPTIPKEDMAISIVTNAQGKMFPLLHLSKDTGASTLKKSFVAIPKKETNRRNEENFRWEDEELEDWSDPYGDERAYYNGWNKDDVEDGQADVFEGDYDAYNSK